jgi:uncharacterized protein with beta-barrel porin domain
VTLDSNTISANCALTVPPGTYTSALGPDATANELAVAAAIAAFPGTPSIAFQVLPTALTPDELAAAYTELSGEAATGVAPAASQAMNSFLSQIFDSAFADDTTPESPTAPGPATVKTLDYASENTPSPGPGLAIASPGSQWADPARWGVWASGYGGTTNTEGDVSVGSHDRSANIWGVAAGFDQHVTAQTTVGVAFGGGGTNFALADDLGGGNSRMLQAALYARTNFDAAYLTGSVAYAYHDVSTERFVTMGAGDYASDFSANDIGGRLETGYRLGWLIPYAAVEADALYTPAYAERTVSGSSSFALQYDANTATDARTELGVRLEQTIAFHDGNWLSLRARAAWAHDYGSASTMVAGFQQLPGPTFTVEGARADADSVLLSAGAEFGFRNGFAIGGSFDSEFADNSQTYSGTGRISYRW